MVTAAMKLKDTCSLEKSYDQPRQHFKNLTHYFGHLMCRTDSLKKTLMLVKIEGRRTRG